MTFNFCTRREVFLPFVSILPVMGFVGKARSMSGAVPSGKSEEISRSCECIHQEVMIQASCARVYQALTDAKQFSRVTDFSIPGASTAISGEVGGTFSLFGGVITGRHIEMVPNERLVQAWRDKAWAAGVYSIAKFQLIGEGSSTRLVFDHTGFPQGEAEDLAAGWKSHYWEPLRKYLV